MTARFREARREDVAAIVAMLADDALGAGREDAADLAPYLAAFDRIAADPDTQIVVGEDETGRVVACAQLDILRGLSIRAATRAQIEGVRVAEGARGSGLGAALIAECEARARAAGATLIQLTTNRTRERAHAFYARQGYEQSHLGFKKKL